MSSDWLLRTLGEFIRLQRGHDLPASKQQAGKIPIMGSAGPNGTHNVAIAKGPGVVIGRSGASAGRVHFSNVDYWPHNTCLYVTDFLGNNPHFVYYLLQTIDLASFNSGSAQPSLNRNYLYTIQINAPGRDEQDRIVEILTTLDDRITLLRETNATLEAIAQAIFKSWFVDFDPVRAKMEGRAPEGMDEATAALFPDSFEESELGLVPKGWRWGNIESVAERVGMGPFGSNIKVETFVNNGVPVISGQHLKQALVEDTMFNFIAEDHAERLKKSCVRHGDVIFTHAGSIGQVSLLHGDSLYDQYVLSQRQFFLRCKKIAMEPEWLLYYFRSPHGQHQLLANTSQVGVPSIARPVSYLRSIMILIPPCLIISKFSSIADALHRHVINNRKQINTLANLRDTLLPRLISGKLRLPEAENAIAEAIA